MLCAGFIIVFLSFHIVSCFFIRRCTAAVHSLTLSTQVFWSFIFEVAFKDNSSSRIEYYISFPIFVLGMFLYIKYPLNLNKDYKTKILDDHLNQQLLADTLRNRSIVSNDTTNTSSIEDNNNFINIANRSNTETTYNYYKNKNLHIGASKYMRIDQ